MNNISWNKPLVMVKLNHRFVNEKKGITPVIATIILIAGTLVLALVTGGYSFGVFGSNVKSVTVASAAQFISGTEDLATSAGSSLFQLVLSNPGGVTWIAGITVTGSQVSAMSTWSCTDGGANVATAWPNPGTAGCTAVSSGASSLNIYPLAASATIIPGGATVNYAIRLGNGQTVSGVLITQ